MLETTTSFIQRGRVIMGMSFIPSSEPDTYDVFCMAHVNKKIVQAYITGDPAVRERFEYIISGRGLPLLFWCAQEFKGMYAKAAVGTTFKFSVPNQRLADIYKLYLPRFFPQMVVKDGGHAFSITKQ